MCEREIVHLRVKELENLRECKCMESERENSVRSIAYSLSLSHSFFHFVLAHALAQANSFAFSLQRVCARESGRENEQG